MLTSYTVETASLESKAFLKETEAAFGFIPNGIKILAGSPGTYEAYSTLFEIFFHKITLSMLEAQIVLMTSSLENNILEILVGLAAKLISNFSNSIADTELDDSMLKHK
jgi:hypothetical protein